MAIAPLPDENELIIKISKGDKRAFTILFDGYYKTLAAYIFKLTESLEVTEEIVQDVFIKIWLKREGLSEINALRHRCSESKDKGAKPSENYRTVFVIVKGSYSNVADAQPSLSGTLASRATWAITVSNTTSGALAPAMADGNVATAWRSSNSSTALKWVSVDMGTEQQIKGFRLLPNYISVAENATGITVSTSVDNVTWTPQGAWKGTGPAATSSAASPDIKNINFIVPVQARYFRFDITSWTSGNRVGIGELNVVQ